jgi:RHH-type transcriptional regulator, rel operon repressor / antitoxin RelB
MTTSTFTVRVDDTQKRRLEALAKSTGRSRSFLAADAINAYLDVNEWQVEGIRQAIDSMDANGGVEHAAVKDWVKSWKGFRRPYQKRRVLVSRDHQILA